MRVTYTPEDPTEGEPRTWSFNSRRVRASVCIAIEKQWGGGDYDDWRTAVLAGDTHARRVLLHHLLRTADGHTGLRFADTPDFFYDEFVVEADAVELKELRESVATMRLNPGKTEEDRAAALALLDEELAKANTIEGTVVEGKAP